MLCKCGCGKETKYIKKYKKFNCFINGHNGKVLRETRICSCGCGNYKVVRTKSRWKYFIGHANKSLEDRNRIRNVRLKEWKEKREWRLKICRDGMKKRRNFNGVNNPNFGNHKLAGKNNPRYGKLPGNAKRYWFDVPNQGRVCLRSSWELVVATYLVAKQVDFRYEIKRFILDAKTFLPDFYLVKEDKFIEVKGFADDGFKQKMREMPIFYPEVKVEVFTGKEIRDIRNKSIRPNEIGNSEV